MSLVVVILQIIYILKILVAHAAVVMIRAVYEVLPSSSVGDEVAVTIIANVMVRRVALMLSKGGVVLEVSIASVTELHGSDVVCESGETQR